MFFIDGLTVGPRGPNFGMGAALDLEQVKTIVAGSNRPSGGGLRYGPKGPIGCFGVEEAS